MFKFGYSRNIYRIPVSLNEYRRFPNSPEHKGPFKYAEDIAVPDPRTEQTVVYAPHNGVVWACELRNISWGHYPNFKTYLNWLNVLVDGYEFYELCHVANLPGRCLRAGDKIKKGEPILVCALNGFITETNGVPDSHLHMMVGRWKNKEKTKFSSLKIRWEE